MNWDWNRYYEPDDCVVWKYQRDNPSDVLGRAIVDSSDNGVRVYCKNKDLAKKIIASETNKKKTIKDVWETLTEDQKRVVYFMVGHALENAQEKETFGFVQEVNEMIKPTKIIYSGRKTIVFWNDGTKTIVTRTPEDQFDVYTAFCAALAKKMFNTTSAAKRMVDKLSVFQNSRDNNTLIERAKDDQGNADQLVADVPHLNIYEPQPINKSDLGTDEIGAVVDACKDFADSMAKLGIAVGDISIKFGKSAANALKNAINNRKDGNK